jgi:hypothetical protein
VASKFRVRGSKRHHNSGTHNEEERANSQIANVGLLTIVDRIVVK